LIEAWTDERSRAVFDQDSARLDAVRADRAEAAAALFRGPGREWDSIRSLHVAEEEVERAIDRALGRRGFGTLVDIGTGTGRMIELFGPASDQAIGIDRSSEMLRLARVKLESAGVRSSLRQGDMYALPLADGSADCASSTRCSTMRMLPRTRLPKPLGYSLPVRNTCSSSTSPPTTARSCARATRICASAFADEVMAGWFAAAGLEVDHVEHLEGGELTVTLVARRKAVRRAEAEGRMNRHRLEQLKPSRAAVRAGARRHSGQLRILPAQNRDDGRDLVAVDPDACAARPAVRLGHLWRRRLDPRAHPRDRRADPRRDRFDAGGAPHLRRRKPRRESTPSPAITGKWAFGTWSRLRGDPPEPGASLIRAASGRLCQCRRAGRRAEADRAVRHLGRRYPEVHPTAAAAKPDLDNLKRKIDAGADRAITQFFFSAESFFRFRTRRGGGIDIEMVPGILPVSNVAHDSAEVRPGRPAAPAIPQWLDELFEGLDDLPAARQLIAATVAAELVRAALCRRRTPFPLLHAQPGRAQLRDLPFARSSAEMSAAANLPRAEAAERILIKDGAYGTMIQAERLAGKTIAAGST
jgi:hypothetical protein